MSTEDNKLNNKKYNKIKLGNELIDISLILNNIKKALVISSYKNGTILIKNYADKDINIMDNRPMALHINNNKILCSVGYYIKEFELSNKDNNFILKNNKSLLTSDVDIHDINIINGNIYFISSLLNSICMLTVNSNKYFKIVWKPKFITENVLEDRCHLNGMCVINNKIRYVTAVSTTNIYKGWKSNRKRGGVIIDVDNGIILDNLSMPHSPYYMNGYLYFLNSGKGELCRIKLNNDNKLKNKKLKNSKLNDNNKIKNKKYNYEVITFIPGFLRGLEIYNNIAFIGVSKDRHDSCFRGLELENKIKDYNKVECGVYAIDLKLKKIISFMKYNANEIYDVKLMNKS